MKDKRLQAHLTIVPAAGKGERLGAGVPKAWADVGGRPLVAWTLEHLAASHACPQIVLVADPPSPEWRDPTIYRRFGCGNVLKVVSGGETRSDSVRRGLHAFPVDGDALVLIHDAARPLVTPDDIEAVLQAAAADGAAVGGWRLADTMARVSEDGRIVGNVDREGLFAVATPQAFRFEVLENAYRKAGAALKTATDEASIVTAAGYPVRTVPVSRLNFKVTFPADLEDVQRFAGVSTGAFAARA